MAVKVKDRNTSKIEYLYQTRKLTKYIVDRASHLKTKSSFAFSRRLTEKAIDIYELAQQLNATYLTKETYETKLKLEEEIKINLSILRSDFSLMVDIFDSEFQNKDVVSYVAGLIDNVYQLINGLMKSDKERYKALLL